jgi:hypothetical protein
MIITEEEEEEEEYKNHGAWYCGSAILAVVHIIKGDG